MTWKFWKRASAPVESSPFERELIYRLALIEKRLGRIENDVALIQKDVSQIKEDNSATRGAVVGIHETLSGHMDSHEQDAKHPNVEARRERLRRVPTLSEER